MSQDEQVQFTWTLEREEAGERYRELQDAGAQAEKVELGEGEQLLPLAAVAAAPAIAPYVAPVIIAGTIGFVAIADKIIRILDRREPGLVIDVRGRRLNVYEQRGIPHYAVLVVTSKGTTTHDLRNDPILQTLSTGDAISTLIKSALAGETGSDEDASKPGAEQSEG